MSGFYIQSENIKYEGEAFSVGIDEAAPYFTLGRLAKRWDCAVEEIYQFAMHSDLSVLIRLHEGWCVHKSYIREKRHEGRVLSITQGTEPVKSNGYEEIRRADIKKLTCSEDESVEILTVCPEERCLMPHRLVCQSDLRVHIDEVRRFETAQKLCLEPVEKGKLSDRKAAEFGDLDNQHDHEGKTRGAEGGVVLEFKEDYWVATYAGKESSLKNLKGIHYISYLLSRPRKDICVLELVRAINKQNNEEIEHKACSYEERNELTSDPQRESQQDEVDKKAKNDCNRKIMELDDRIEIAKDTGNEDGIDTLEEERKQIEQYLSAGLKIKGSPRNMKSTAEKARKAVSKAITRALEDIKGKNAPLGDYLKKSIKTGRYSSYHP